MKPTPRTHALKTTLIALMLAAVNPAHATGVPTVDGSAILTNLQQWYQNAQRWYSDVQNKSPGQLAINILGNPEATKQADSYISALQQAKQQMQQANACQKYPVEASKMLCVQEEDLKVQKLDAYIKLLEGVKVDYDKLSAKLSEYNGLGFSLGNVVTAEGTNTNDGKRKTLETEIDQLRQQILTNMQQHKGQIDMIDGQLNMVHGIRVDVGRVQFEGNAGGLSDLIKKGAVTATLETATQEYKNKADAAKTSTIRYNNGQTKTGTNY